MVFKAIGWLIAIAAVAVPAGWYLTREQPIEVTVHPVERGTVEQTIAALSSGIVMPSKKAMVAAGMMGKIAAVHVEEGAKVNEGDLLVELEHNDLDAQVALSEANLRTGRTRLAQAKLAAGIEEDVASTQLNQSSAQLAQAQRDFERLQALLDQQAISRRELENASVALRLAQEAQNAATAGTRQKLVRAEEIKSAESGIEQLEAALAAAQAMRDKAFVKAPFSGTVAKILLKEGEAVAMGLPLMQLVQQDPPYITAPFDEANLSEMKEGQPVRIEIDAYPDRTFAGEVQWISPVVNVNQDLSRTLEVKVRILEEVDKFVPGMSADVTIIASKKEDVLYAPSESLVRNEFAYVVQNGHAIRRDVEVGIGNWETRELLSGLQEGDRLITSINIKGLDEGVPVEVVEELQD
ncbi:MAG: efflux RND transporter periplasmic adaptor subunit [Candidatus Hydrogenedentes bacterium]|nr:efflux RND transporter periplasmic adaptor subunit [Candidatus Hydrogenedentota bacterium]